MALNRRAFLKSLFAGVVGSALIDTNVDGLLQKTNHLSDVDFIAYMTVTMNLWVHNPAHSAIITNIGEP